VGVGGARCDNNMFALHICAKKFITCSKIIKIRKMDIMHIVKCKKVRIKERGKFCLQLERPEIDAIKERGIFLCL
jgi:hypothetical protein